MSDFHLLLLGRPTVKGPAGTVPIRTHKGQALLFYLAAEPERTVSRREVAGLLWERSEEASARATLTTVLGTLRQDLPDLPLRITRDSLAWEPAARVEIDAVRFSQLTGAAGRGAAVPPSPADLVEAVALYRGPFLDGVALPDCGAYEEWLAAQRVLWERRVLAALAQLAGRAEAAGRWEALEEWARRAIELDPLQERFHRWCMTALAAQGDRAAALAHYEACRQVLREALDVDPDPATRALRDAIAAGSAHGGGRPAGLRAGPQPLTPLAAPLQRPDRPLIGRQRDLGRVESALSRTTAGPLRGVLVSGEAGIGKTRLVQEVLAAGRHPAAGTVLVGRCHESSRGVPYAPYVEAFAVLSRRLTPSALPLRPVWWSEVADILPDLDPPLAVTGPRRRQAGSGSAGARHRLSEGVVRLLGALPQPVLLVLEDLHWADAASLELLARVLRHPLTPTVAVLATARPGDLSDGAEDLLHDLQREGALEWQEMGGLALSDMGDLARAVTGRDLGPASGWLHRQSGGNPLFAIEILLAGGGTGEHLAEVPPVVRSVIRSGLAALPQPAAAVLQAAAVFGNGAQTSVLHDVAGLGEPDAAAALQLLLRRRILRAADASPSPETRMAGPGPVIFAHELVRRVVREAMSADRRAALHRAAYVRLAAATPEPARLAYHAARAGLWEDALTWSLRAAEAARSYPESAGHLDQALACLAQLPSTPPAGGQGLDIRLRRADLELYHQPARAEDRLQTLAAEALDPARRLQLRQAEARSLMLKGQLARAETMLTEGVPRLRARIYLGQVRALRGEFGSAADLLQGVERQLAEPPWHLVEAAGTLAWVWGSLGDFARAEALARALVVAASREGGAAACALAHLAWVLHVRGRWTEAADVAEHAVARARAWEAPLPEYLATVALGLPLARTGRLHAGIRAARAALDLGQALGVRVWRAHVHAHLAEMLLEAGEPAEAAAVAVAGLAVASADGDRFGLAMCARAQGLVAAADGRGVQARQQLLAALTALSGLKARPEAGRSHAALARVAPGDAGAAAHRARAAAIFTSLGMDWDLAQLP